LAATIYKVICDLNTHPLLKCVGGVGSGAQALPGHPALGGRGPGGFGLHTRPGLPWYWGLGFALQGDMKPALPQSRIVFLLVFPLVWLIRFSVLPSFYLGHAEDILINLNDNPLLIHPCDPCNYRCCERQAPHPSREVSLPREKITRLYMCPSSAKKVNAHHDPVLLPWCTPKNYTSHLPRARHERPSPAETTVGDIYGSRRSSPANADAFVLGNVPWIAHPVVIAPML
jgi:hypothetical protein